MLKTGQFFRTDESISSEIALVIRWRGGPLDTRVRFDHQEATSGTRLTLRHEGVAGLSNVIPRIALGFGWKDRISKTLPGHLETLEPA